MGVAVLLTGPLGAGDPGSPEEERRQCLDLFGITDESRGIEGLGVIGIVEHPLVVDLQLLDRVDLRVGEDDVSRSLVPGVRLDLPGHPGVDRILVVLRELLAALLRVELPHRDDGAMQRVGREVRPSLGAVAPEGAVAHQAAEVEHLLALLDGVARDHYVAFGRHEVDERRSSRIGLRTEVDESSETDRRNDQEVDPPRLLVV